MVSLKGILKDYRDSRAFHTLVNIYGYLDARTWLTKTGDVASVLLLGGPDTECLEPQQLDGVVNRLTSGLRVFGGNFVVNQYWTKRLILPLEAESFEDPFVNMAARTRREYLNGERKRLFSFETHLVITRKPDWRMPSFSERLSQLVKKPRATVAESLSTQARMSALREPLERATGALHRSINSFIEQVRDDFSVRVLDRSESFRFLRTLLNPDHEKAAALPFAHDIHVDFFAVDSELACYGNHLRVGNVYIKLLTLKEPPAHSFANMLRNLCRIQAEIVVVTEWHPWDPARAVGTIRSKGRHFHNTKLSFLNHVSSERPYEREMMFDDSKEALVDDLGRCLQEMEMKGLQIGEFSLTVMLLGDSFEAVERACAEVARTLGAHEAVMNEETYNGLSAFLAALPAGYPYNLRKLVVSNRNFVDMGLWFVPSEGERQNGFLGASSLVTLETEDQSLYHFNFHVQDVGHTLVLGPTGTGKSFLVNFFIAQTLTEYRII